MAMIKICSQVGEAEWNALRNIACESDRSISGLLTEAIADYVRKRSLGPVVLNRLEESMGENEDLGRHLTQ